MRAFALFLLLVAPAARAAEVTLGFDDVASGTVISEYYADQGATFTGLGNGGPFDAEAKLACVTSASPPNAIGTTNLGTCPEFSAVSGFVRVVFETPQPRVSVMVTHVDATTTTYVRVYQGDQFLDQRFGNSSSSLVGLPQKIELTRQENDPWITVMEFGAFSGAATFDDLSFAIGPVVTKSRTWSLVKSRY
jgi:hypothetical protein